MASVSRGRSSWGKVAGNDQMKPLPIVDILGTLLKPGEVIELRVSDAPHDPTPGRRHLLANGYFDDPVKLTQAAAAWQGKAAGLFFTVNPVHRELLWAAYNRLRRPAGWTTVDADITRRTAIGLTFEANARSSGSPDDVHHQAAFHRADACRTFLGEAGWPEPLLADSASAISLLYAVDLLNTREDNELVKQVLVSVAQRFDDSAVHIDTGADHAAMLCPVYGTVTLRCSRDRRLCPSVIQGVPNRLLPVDRSLLEAIARLPVDGIHRVSASQETGDTTALREFVQTKCVLTPESWTQTAILYRAYQLFRYDCRIPTLPVPRFARQLITCFELEAQRRKVRGVVTRGIRGICLPDTSVS
jgi:hypothetical protein